jgi:hypothetical protein
MSAYPTWGADKFNLPDTRPASSIDSGMNAMTTPAAADHDGGLLHPGNPLLAFGVLAAVAFGLMAVSTTVRVGKTTASVQVGATK